MQEELLHDSMQQINNTCILEYDYVAFHRNDLIVSHKFSLYVFNEVNVSLMDHMMVMAAYY